MSDYKIKLADMCLLDPLERERDAKREMKFAGDSLMDFRRRQMETDDELKSALESLCDLYTEKRDDALRELNRARADMMLYFKYHGITPTAI